MARFQLTVYPADLTPSGDYRVHVTQGRHVTTFDAKTLAEVEAEASAEAQRLNTTPGGPCVVAVRILDGRAPVGWRGSRLEKRWIECRRPVPGYAAA